MGILGNHGTCTVAIVERVAFMRLERSYEYYLQYLYGTGVEMTLRFFEIFSFFVRGGLW